VSFQEAGDDQRAALAIGPLNQKLVSGDFPNQKATLFLQAIAVPTATLTAGPSFLKTTAGNVTPG
jgi:hypothetical protein